MGWAERNLLTKIWAFQSIQNYLHRLTVLFTINVYLIHNNIVNCFIIK